MDPDTIYEMDKKAIEFKKIDLPSKYKQKGNVAYMELDNIPYYAHSSINYTTDKGYKNAKNNQQNIVLLNDKRKYKTIFINKYDRCYDTEAKFFEYVSNIKNKNDKFIINMISERCMCKSCESVMKQFQKDYPNAIINVVSNKNVKLKNPSKYRLRGGN